MADLSECAEKDERWRPGDIKHRVSWEGKLLTLKEISLVAKVHISTLRRWAATGRRISERAIRLHMREMEEMAFLRAGCKEAGISRRTAERRMRDGYPREQLFLPLHKGKSPLPRARSVGKRNYSKQPRAYKKAS